MTERELFIVLISNERLKNADAIILLEGDGFNRIPKALELVRAGYSTKIVLSGGADNPANGSLHSKLLFAELIKKGFPEKDIIMETQSKHTREQAAEIMKLVKTHSWKRILLVASHYHQYRAYLTFLQAMFEEQVKDLQIINAPCSDLPWFIETGWGTRFALLEDEFKKIEQYREKGHISTFAKAIEYQQWKEQQA